MSSIFNGDSIYKSGGGGGGYKDGGQIVDSELMKVENNAVSSYDNVNRDTINFYFDPADGEILNSIIELTTAVNATVNIYVFRNGFYYLLGNVGGNTVTAGNDYKVNVTGDSFSIEEVSSAQEEIFIDVFGVLMPVVKIGNKYWTSENLYSVFDGLTIGGTYQMTSPAAWWYQNDSATYGHKGTKYNLYYNVAAAKYIDNNIGGGWRVATKYDFQQMISYVGDLSKIFADGTNETGLSLVLNGNYAYDNYWNQVSTATSIRYRDDPPYSYGPFISGDKVNIYYNTLTEDSGRGVPIRLVHDV